MRVFHACHLNHSLPARTDSIECGSESSAAPRHDGNRPYCPFSGGTALLGKSMQPVRDIEEMSLETKSFGGRFAARFAQIGPLAGAEKLGGPLAVVPQGKAAWRFHSHLVSDDLVFVLAGRGVLRFGEARYPRRPGDGATSPVSLARSRRPARVFRKAAFRPERP